MKKLLAFVLLVGLGGCTMNSAPDSSKLKSNNLSYFKDERTGICFAAMNSAGYSGYETTAISYVPCSPEVEKLIQASR